MVIRADDGLQEAHKPVNLYQIRTGMNGDATRCPRGTGRICRPFVTAAAAAFVVLYALLSVHLFRHQGLAIDESGHLMEGYLSLAHETHLQSDHPDLLNRFFALPILGARFDPEDAPRDAWQHLFYFEQNQLESLLWGPRMLVTLVAAGMGLLVCAWAYEEAGAYAGLVGLGLFLLEPNILCNCGVVTQDLGITALFFATIYMLHRVTKRLAAANALGLGLLLGLSLAAKFSGAILWPIVLMVLTVRVFDGPWAYARGCLVSRSARAKGALVLAAVALVTSWLVVWADYGFRYDSPQTKWGGGHRAEYQDPLVRQRLPVSSSVIGWIDRAHLLPNVFTQNLLRQEMNVSSNQFASYLLGRSRFGGWPWYFPVVFAVKTPVSLLFLFGAGLALGGWKGRWTCLLLPPACYFGACMRSHLDLGVRHLLPIFPFVIVVAAVGAGELLRRHWPWPGRRIVGRQVNCAPLLVVGALVCATVEFSMSYPNCRGFFNAIAGGPGHGDRILLDNNIDWGEDLPSLKDWMVAHDVSHINLGYWGVDDPHHYGISFVCLPTTMQSAPSRFEAPKLPGYICASVQLLRDPAFADIRNFYGPLLRLEPVARLGSLRVYWVE
jgi:hypothetical protein